jgi:predicted ATP-grasp superfamily ATP-dependent carboligase
MKKVSYVLAALATIAVAAPTVASAESFGFRVGSDRDYYRDRDYRDSRAEFYGRDRGMHRGWYKNGGDRTVIIKRHRHWDD